MNAQQLKSSILQKAIEGRLIPQDPNDEPASVLLERIREVKRRLVKEGKLKKKDLEETPIGEDEIPFNLPDGWEWCRIDSYTNKVTDYVASGSFASLRENVKYYKDENYALLVKIKDFQSGFKRDLTFTDKHGYEFLENSNLFGGELILSNVGSIGKIFIVPKLNRKMTLAPNAIMVRLWNEEHRDWLFYLFQSPFGIALLYDISSATAIRKFNKTDFKKLIIPLPPLAEQHRIVERIEEFLPVIKEYGEAYDEASKMDAELPDKLKKSILQEAIMGRLGTQDPNDEPASVLLEQIREEKKMLVKKGVLKKKDLIETPVEEDEEPFKIPESWEWIRFGDLVSTFTGKTPARGEMKYWGSDDYSWVSISDMKQGEVINKTKECISQAASDDCFHGQISKRGTLLMSFKLTVGRTSILGIDAYHNEAIISIKTYADVDNYTRDYLEYILPVIANWGDSKDAIKGKTLNSKSIYNLLIPLPPLAEQHRIVEKIETLFREIDNITINNDHNETETEETDNE